jgi:nucleotide-binding universal stress UspA family protein
MLRRILVPLDGSLRAERALPIAARLARGSGSTLVLCRMVGRPSELALYGSKGLEAVPSEVTPRLEQATAYLAAVASSEIVAGCQTETVVADGLVAEEILAAISRRAIDLVVMCSHGHSEPTRWLLGSVAEKVARLSEAPVLVLREQGAGLLEQVAALASGSHPVRALVPLDGSPLAEAALQPTADVVAALSPQAPCTLHLMSVLPPDEQSQRPMHTHESGERIARGEVGGKLNAYLARVASRVKQSNPHQHPLEISWSVTYNTDVAATILRTVGQQIETEVGLEDRDTHDENAVTPGDFHLICITTHGSGGKQPWSIGTVTDRVLCATELSLLLVRP